MIFKAGRPPVSSLLPAQSPETDPGGGLATQGSAVPPAAAWSPKEGPLPRERPFAFCALV